MTDVVIPIRTSSRRVIHTPTGLACTVFGVDADGYQVAQFDGEQYTLSLRGDGLAEATPAAEVAAALTRSDTLVMYSDEVDDRLRHQEVRRVNEAEGMVESSCRWCDGIVWVPSETVGLLFCRSCQHKDGG